MRILDRYILREILGPTLLGIPVFTFILLTEILFDLAEAIIQRHVPVALVGSLLLTKMPSIIVLTIPMSLLFGILIAVGRLSSDSELVAIRAAGLSLFQLYRPVLLLSAFLTLTTTYLMLEVLPRGNQASNQITLEIYKTSATRQIQPGVFFEELENQILYVFDRAETGEGWRGVFLADAIPGDQHTATVARNGRIQIDEATGEVRVQLSGRTDYELNLETPKEYNVISYDVLEVAGKDASFANRDARQALDDERSVNLSTLLAWARDPECGERSEIQERCRKASVEIHKRFAIPTACLVFGLFGVPLGFSNRRGGRSSGFALSIAIILIYYILLNNGEGSAAQGKMSPWLAMWLPNILFMVAGTFLLARRNRDKSLLLSNVDRWIRQHFWARRLSRKSLRQQERDRKLELLRHKRRGRVDRVNRSGGVVFRIERPRLGFPNTLDRYVLSVFTRVFLLVLAAGTSIYVIANFTDLVDEVIKHDIASSVVLDYYSYFSFQIAHQILPFVILIATLIAFGLLSRTNEVTASKALGVSLMRLSLPVVLAGVLLAGCDAALESSVLPHSNAKVAQIKDRIQGREQPRTHRRADKQWFYGADDAIYNYQYYDRRDQSMQRLHVFRVDPEAFTLRSVLYSAVARFEDGRWLADAGWELEFPSGKVRQLRDWVPIDISESPEFFDSEIKQPAQMNYPELRAYVERLRRSGQAVPELEVELHNKIATPIVCLVMALVALPFAFRLGRRGALYGIGIALGLGIAFYAIIAFFTTLGQAGALPPVVAVWSPNVLFASLSLYVFLGVRS
jgi:LPS export ABC transporter permease LptF/LPS export ABC transporter permease LptG